MMKNRFAVVGGLFIVSCVHFLLLPPQAQSQGLPEGVDVVIISEHKSNIPGIEKVRLIKITIQPGKAWENTPIVEMVL